MSKLVLLLAATLLLTAVPVSAQVYKWTDENGNVHVSDRPPAQKKKPAHVEVADKRALENGDPSWKNQDNNSAKSNQTESSNAKDSRAMCRRAVNRTGSLMADTMLAALTGGGLSGPEMQSVKDEIAAEFREDSAKMVEDCVATYAEHSKGVNCLANARSDAAAAECL